MTKNKEYKPLTKVREELKQKYHLEEWEVDIIKKLHSRKYPVYTTVHKVSRSGMSREINVFIIVNNSRIWLVPLIEKFGTYKRRSGSDYLNVSGCGMDMGFSVVYGFSHTIFPHGFKLHKKEHGRNGDKSSYDNDGGYGLKQRWF